uniref:Reverse transcriptase domain-containing protein n=1 Tax=Tanacetum cinerariifolium TaxID=118510 RepID=A0A6L2L7J0_TANCI|nr:hypothetical protein [Tanacetum cinerariifolium]
MDTTIDQQVVMDEALVPHAKRLRIGRSNFRLLPDISSKESTLQLVYDVLCLSLFFKAFLVTTDVLEIYMQEFWATSTVHHHSIRFKMDNKKHIVNLESFRDMLHICPRLPHQPFIEPPFEEEILAFFIFLDTTEQLGSSLMLTSTSCISHGDPLMPSSTSVEHKDTKKSNEMYYPRHQNTQQFRALLPIEFTNEDIKNSNAYKEYYAVATGATLPKPKASVRKTRSSFGITITTPTAAAGPRRTTSEKGKQAAKASKAKSLSYLFEVAMTEAQQLNLATKKSLQQTHISQASASSVDEGTNTIPGVPDVPTDDYEEDISWKSSDDEGDDDEGNDGDDDDVDDGVEGDGDDDDEDDDGEEGNDDDDDQEDEGDDDEDDEEKGGNDEQASDEEEFIHPSLSTHTEEEPMDEKSFDPIPKTPKDTDDEGNGEENLGLNVGREEGHDEKEEEDELYRDVNINQGSVAPLPMYAPTITPSTIATITTTIQAPTPPTTAPSTLIQDLPNFGSLFSFDNQLRTLEANLFEFMQTNQFAGAVSSIPEIVQRYMDQRINEAVKIIKEQVKEQVKVQVSKILSKIKQTVNEQLEAEVLTRSSHSSKTSYAVAADLSEIELKNILIKKMESNKSIQRSNEQRNHYKALGRKRLQFYGFAVNRESARDVYSKRRIIAVIELKIVDWHNYKQLDWITVRRDDDKLYKFNEVDFKRLRIQDIEDMLLLPIQGKLTNLTVEERFSFNRNKLMRIDELHKFNDGKLTDVRTALDDRLKGIQMKDLPKSIWRKSDKDRAATMIQAIDKMLKTRRIMRSLERNPRLLSGIEDSHHVPSDAMHNPSQPLKAKKTLFQDSQRYTYFYRLPHSELVASDALNDFQIKFSISIGETITHWFTLIVLSALRRSDNENMLSLINLVTPTKPRRMTKPYPSHRFIANCFNAGNFKMEVKTGIHVKSFPNTLWFANHYYKSGHFWDIDGDLVIFDEDEAVDGDLEKDKQEKDKIRSKPGKNGKRGEAERSQKQLQRVVPTNYNPKRERFLIASRFPTPPLACAFFSPGATVTNIEYKILVPKLPKNCARYEKCGHPNIFESSNDSTNVVNAPREPVVVKQDHGVNPPHIDKCCCECGNALDGIYCQQCIFLIQRAIPTKKTQYLAFQNLTLLMNLPTFSTHLRNLLYILVKIAEAHTRIFSVNWGPHETFQCQPTNEEYYHEQNSCYNSNSFGSNHCQPPKYTVNHPIFNSHNDFLNSQNELSIAQNTIMEQMTQLTSMCELVCQFFQKKQEEKRIEEEQVANARYWKILACCDDDDDYDYAITPEETDNSLSMGDEHLDTILATGSDEVIKSSVENLVPIPSESEGITDTMCDVHLVKNPTPLEAKDRLKIVLNSNDDISSSDDDSFYNENIEYVEVSPHDSELVSLEAAEIVILKVEEIEDDNLREKLLNSSSTSPKSFLEETNTFHNSLPEFENFCFDLEEITSGSTTTHSDISLLDYEAFHFDDDHIKEISSGSTTTHSDVSLSEYDSFIFDLTHEEFVDELAHIISPPEYDCFYFWNLPDPGITINLVYSFKPGLSYRCGAFKKFNTHRSHLNECPMIINGKNTPILDVLLFHFYPLDQLKYGGDWVKHRDLKQALRGRHPMLISSLIFLFSS